MKPLLKTAIIIAAIAGVLLAAALILGPDRARLDADARDASPYAFVELSEGVTEYEVAGPPNGEPVVLIHGLSIPMFDFDRLFEDLAGAGFRVLRYNQYGRGLSDRPRGAYDMDRYVAQLTDLIDHFGWDHVHLVGHSMGTAIAAGFAVAHEERVDRIVMVSPVLHLKDGNGGMTLARVPLIGDFASKVVIARVLSGRAEDLFAATGTPLAAEYNAAMADQMRYRGFTRATKSLFRGDVVDDLAELWAAQDGSRILAVWGTRDESVPQAHLDRIVDLVPGMATLVLDGIGHMPTIEAPDRTVDAIITYLRDSL